AWKDHDIVINQVELKNGDISGTFEGKLNNMEKSKKITNNELLEFFNKKFDDIDKRFDDIDKRLDGIDKRLDNIDKRLDNIDSKIDLMLATPTMNKEIDHEALRKLQ
ncbi:MAG: hypothetical protein KFW07_03815, partial [Mycoplasmataceae bacterium]|nr:hypothetical protein [Mycoplasmataceae bacterium]